MTFLNSQVAGRVHRKFVGFSLTETATTISERGAPDDDDYAAGAIQRATRDAPQAF
jgi:hypothetical protein